MTMLKKIVKKLTRVSLNRLINDTVYIGVNYALTGNVINAIAGLSTMKVISTTTFMFFDEIKMTPMKKALVWEAIISVIGMVINGVLTGNIMMALKITMAMKICIPINAWFFKKTEEI